VLVNVKVYAVAFYVGDRGIHKLGPWRSESAEQLRKDENFYKLLADGEYNRWSLLLLEGYMRTSQRFWLDLSPGIILAGLSKSKTVLKIFELVGAALDTPTCKAPPYESCICHLCASPGLRRQLERREFSCLSPARKARNGRTTRPEFLSTATCLVAISS
jgi:hypothetical protein